MKKLYSNNTKIVVRDANKDDIGQIKKLAEYLMRVEDTGDIKKQAGIILKQRIKPSLAGFENKTFVALVDGKIVGFLLVEIKHNLVVSLAFIAVDPQYQGLGIGRKLVEHAAQYAKSQKIKILQGIIHKNNKKSMAFHEKLGFRLFGYVLRKEIK